MDFIEATIFDQLRFLPGVSIRHEFQSSPQGGEKHFSALLFILIPYPNFLWTLIIRWKVLKSASFASSTQLANESRHSPSNWNKQHFFQGIPLSVGSWFGGPRLLVDVEPQSMQGEARRPKSPMEGGWVVKNRGMVSQAEVRCFG